MRHILLIALISLSGCASMSTEEKVWQGMHAIDTLQTLQISRNPECFKEADPITSRLIGKHPSEGKVIAWAITSSYLYHKMAEKVEKSDSFISKAGFYGFTLLTKGITIGNNERIGLHFYGAECN